MFASPSDGRIHRTHQDFVRCRDDRLRSRAADPIHGHGRDLDRQSPVDRRLMRDTDVCSVISDADVGCASSFAD